MWESTTENPFRVKVATETSVASYFHSIFLIGLFISVRYSGSRNVELDFRQLKARRQHSKYLKSIRKWHKTFIMDCFHRMPLFKLFIYTWTVPKELFEENRWRRKGLSCNQKTVQLTYSIKYTLQRKYVFEAFWCDLIRFHLIKRHS